MREISNNEILESYSRRITSEDFLKIKTQNGIFFNKYSLKPEFIKRDVF